MTSGLGLPARGARLAAVAVCAAALLSACGTQTVQGPGAVVDTGLPAPSRPAGGASLFAAPACPPAPAFATPPRRVATLDDGAAALLIALGLGDRIVGSTRTAQAADFTGSVREQLDALPVLSEDRANQESVLAARPEVVVGLTPYQLGSFPGAPTIQALDQAGIGALVACLPTAAPTTDIQSTYDFVRELGRVFEVQAASAELVAQMRAQVASAVAPYAGAPPVRVLTLTTPPGAGQAILAVGGVSLPNGILTMAGADSLGRDTTTDFTQLSAEVVARADPEAIVAVTGLTGDAEEQFLEAIRTSPVLATTTAVRQDRVVAVRSHQFLAPSLLNTQALRVIADGIHRPAR